MKTRSKRKLAFFFFHFRFRSANLLMELGMDSGKRSPLGVGGGGTVEEKTMKNKEN